MEKNASDWIEKLGLLKHPEGGYFKEVYRSDETIPGSALPHRFKGNRCYSTSIYFLLESEDFSAFHRIQSEEIWHFYKGSALTLYVIDENGVLSLKHLGEIIDDKTEFQIVIPRNTWFAAKVDMNNSYALVGCTVAPGFDFSDFELADCSELCNLFPQHKLTIHKFTK
jgi:predicted cupin superfamily sugar epimerase